MADNDEIVELNSSQIDEVSGGQNHGPFVDPWSPWLPPQWLIPENWLTDPGY